MELPLVVGYTSKRGNTGELVESVRKRRENYPDALNLILDSVEALTNNAKEALLQNNEKRFGELMNINHGLLDAMERFCSMAEKLGILDLPKSASVYGSPKAVNRALARADEHRDKYLLVTTGHQGEPDALLPRIANGKTQFTVKPGDNVIFSSSVIPNPMNMIFNLQILLIKHNIRISCVFFICTYLQGDPCRWGTLHRRVRRNPWSLRLSGSIMKLASMITAAIGMFMMKSHCHPYLRSTAPSTGPRTPETPQTEPIIPRALPRFSGGKVSPMNALATGNIPPAPKP